MRQVMSPSNGIPLYLRDQVGIFHGIAPGEVPENKVSDMKNGDHNSGWHFAKYPFYSDEDAGRREADYSEIRLAEIYYSLAECEFRTGNNEEAGKLLNHVRKRYYPVDKYQEYLYLPDGQIKLTENELIDEWGREFFAEGRRRTDLCRWNKFTTGIWWDKQPDADNHTEIFPLKRSTLNSNPNLVQNPGYDSVSR
ncbi:MAG: RagB/SusD family nutrient uptake outer membrane protein [Parabacteroides merdae]